MSSDRNYYNFLDDRQNSCSFFFASKPLRVTKAYCQDQSLTPQEHKDAVIKSRKIQELLSTVSKTTNKPKDVLERQVKEILDEIGYNKKMKVIRWLGLVLTKICCKTCSGLWTNVAGIEMLRSRMGYCPVIFVPSHRSYQDFIQLSYICFTYDLAIPAIAAGMDFHGMLGIGTMLRDTGAFFMRRSYNDDSLYWTTFKQYVYQIVSKGELPIEFFIEGTRSRSGKSLTPKYGLISMILKALFLSQVPDILFVPISICYERVLEEGLFAYEHLGIPKPKESTSGFFKSLKILKESFGHTYMHWAPVISAKEVFGKKWDRTVHNLAPLHQQEITPQEKSLIPPLAHEIVRSQQKHSVINVFNLMSLVLTDQMYNKEEPISLTEVHKRTTILELALENFGAFVHLGELKDIMETLKVHENLVYVTKEGYLKLKFDDIVLDKIDPKNMKGHDLSNQTMTYSVPFIMLQTYVNPMIHYFLDAALCMLVLKNNYKLSKENLFKHYLFLRRLFIMEFVTYEEWIPKEFEEGLETALKLNLIQCSDGIYNIGNNEYLKNCFLNSIEPFLTEYFITLLVLQNLPTPIEEKEIFKKVQTVVENAINENKYFIHPYCLSLDTLSICLSTLISQKALQKIRRDNKNVYEIVPGCISSIKEQLAMHLLPRQLEFGINHSQMILNKL